MKINKFTNYYEKEYTNFIENYQFNSSTFNLVKNAINSLKDGSLLDSVLEIDLKSKTRIDLKNPLKV